MVIRAFLFRPTHAGYSRLVTTRGPIGASTDGNVDELSTVQLVERLQTQLSTLVRTEIGNALDEVKTKGTQVGIGLGMSGLGIVLLVFGIGTLIACAVLGLATVVPAWLAALIVAAVIIALGGALAGLGAVRAKRAVPPLPEHTTESVRADVSVIKEHLT
jgi:Putative Actinobacterial Holin-X, holin superfamily III